MQYRNPSTEPLTLINIGVIEPGQIVESIRVIENPNLELVSAQAPAAPVDEVTPPTDQPITE